MVDNQIRTFDVTDQRVLAAFETIPRELFLPARLADLAYSDALLTVDGHAGAKRVMPVPMVLARMFQGLALEPDDRVLVVAAASGYAAALAAELCDDVTALESDGGFVQQATAHAAQLGLSRLKVVEGRLEGGDAGGPPFSAILVCGGVEANLDRLFRQLAPGGRLVAVQTASHEATRRSGKVVRFDLIGTDLSSRVLFDATMPVLDAFRAEPTFTF